MNPLENKRLLNKILLLKFLNGRKWPGAVSQSSPKAMALMYRGVVIEFRQLDILLRPILTIIIAILKLDFMSETESVMVICHLNNLAPPRSRLSIILLT